MCRAIVRATVVLTLTASLSACGGIPLHSEIRDKQGQAAATALKEVDLKPFFAAQRANSAKVLEQEVQAESDMVASALDLEIVALSTEVPIKSFLARFNSKLSDLVAPDAVDGANQSATRDAIQEIRSALARRKVNELQLVREQSFLVQAGGPTLTCDDLADLNKGPVSVWRVDHPEFNVESGMMDTCDAIAAQQTRYEKAIRALSRTEGSSLANQIDDLATARKQLTDQRKELAARQADYAQALKDFGKENNLLKQGASTTEAVKAKAKELQQALQAIDGFQGALGTEFVAKEHIKRLNDLLATLGSGKADEGAPKTDIAAAILPKIADDIRAVGNAAKGANLLPLLIKRDVEQARVKAAQVEIASQVADIALRQSMLESTVTEAWLIYKARAAYAEKPGDESLAAFDKLACDAGDRGANLTPLMKDANGRLLDRDCRFDAQWAKLPPNRKFKLLEATGLYLDSIGRQHSVTKRMEVMRQALAAQKASGLSEVNAGMWMSLIDTVVTQAADFGSLGLRGSDFTKLYELLGLTGIAIGTNK